MGHLFACPHPSDDGVLVLASDTFIGLTFIDEVYIMCGVSAGLKNVCFS